MSQPRDEPMESELNASASQEVRPLDASPGRFNPPVLYITTMLWGIAVVLGLGSLWVYATRAGAAGEIAAAWPSESSETYDSNRPTLILFAHPKCPCTRATIDELAWIMTRCRGRVTCRVLFMQPEAESEAWTQTATWTAAAQISDVEVSVDHANHEATAFGAETSGHAMLYDPSGRLLFEGGITPSRGHRGDNLGCTRIVKLVRNWATAVAATEPAELVQSTDVFGCPLSNSSSAIMVEEGVMNEES
ncbi:MAG: hypothetical protein ACR2NZ_07845 [Rubripirellula sp.]